jgi:hypothetical protein
MYEWILALCLNCKSRQTQSKQHYDSYFSHSMKLKCRKHELGPEVVVLEVKGCLEALLCLSLIAKTEIAKTHHAVGHGVDSLNSEA